jgi:hypothetical protein
MVDGRHPFSVVDRRRKSERESGLDVDGNSLVVQDIFGQITDILDEHGSSRSHRMHFEHWKANLPEDEDAWNEVISVYFAMAVDFSNPDRNNGARGLGLCRLLAEVAIDFRTEQAVGYREILWNTASEKEMKIMAAVSRTHGNFPTDHGLLKFLNSQVPCECLKERLRASKTQPKTAVCLGCITVFPIEKLCKCSRCRTVELRILLEGVSDF